MSTKVIFNLAEVSFFWRKSAFRDVRMQSCLALRFLVKRENRKKCFSFKHHFLLSRLHHLVGAGREEEKALGTRLTRKSPPSFYVGMNKKYGNSPFRACPRALLVLSSLPLCLRLCRGENIVLNVNALINKLIIVSFSYTVSGSCVDQGCLSVD